MWGKKKFFLIENNRKLADEDYHNSARDRQYSTAVQKCI